MAHAATTALATGGWRHTSLLDRGTLYCTFGLLLFGPIAFGVTEPWSIFILEAGAAALFGMWAFRQVQSRELHVAGNPLFGPVAVFGALILIQLVAGRSAYAYETISAARLYCTYGILCFLVVQLIRRTSQVQLDRRQPRQALQLGSESDPFPFVEAIPGRALVARRPRL